jgi:hypothetical protein
MGVHQVEFQPFLRNGLGDTRKSPFMVQGKLGFIMDQYGRKSELANQRLVLNVSRAEF